MCLLLSQKMEPTLEVDSILGYSLKWQIIMKTRTAFFKTILIAGLIVFILGLVAFLSTKNPSFFLGKWMLEDNSTDVIFYVHIFEENGQIVGEHCFDNGIVEDCLLGLKHSLYDVVVINDNTVKFTFETGFGAGVNTASDFIGKVKLTRISQNKIR